MIILKREARRRRGVTLVETVVLIAVAALLVGLLLPAVAATQNAAERKTAVKRLSSLGRAVHNFAGTFGTKLPPAVGPMIGKHGTLHYYLLPFLEQEEAYKAGKTDIVVAEFLSPGDPSAPEGNKSQGELPTASFAVNYKVFGNGAPPARMPATFHAGTSNVIIFAERYQVCNGTPMVWGHDQLYYWAPIFNYYNEGKFQVQPEQRDCDPARAQSLVKAGILVCAGDGSVRTVASSFSARTWEIVCNPRSTEPPGKEWYGE